MNFVKLALLYAPYKPPVGVHDEPCKHCPSAHYPIDPECEDILKLNKPARIETAFACAWRTNKHCKGYCDLMGITPKDLPMKPASVLLAGRGWETNLLP